MERQNLVIDMMNNLQRKQKRFAGWRCPQLAWAGVVAALGLMMGVPAVSAQPANDLFAGAEVVSGVNGSVNGTLAGATIQNGEPTFHAVGTRSVWYRWTAPANGRVTFNTQRPSSEAVVAAYNGNSLAGLVSMGAFNAPVSSAVSFNAINGTEYRILVAGNLAPGFNGEFTLTWAVQLPSSGVASAGQFRFSSAQYSASEFETFGSGFALDVPSDILRSAEGAVITVNRVNGSAGRVLVDYRTMDEVPQQLTATVVMEVENIIMSTNMMFFTNEAVVTLYYTNAYDRSGTLFFTDTYLTNFVTTTNFCGMNATCSTTNILLNCAPDFLIRYGCPGSDYFTSAGTLVFDEFETTKRFLVPVDSDAFSFPFFFLSPNGNKQVRLELFNPRLAPEELANPVGLQPPTFDHPANLATLNVIETFPVNGGTNFTFERFSYAVNESAGEISIDIIHPSGVGGSFDLYVYGVEERPLGWVPGIGSDYANRLPQAYGDSVYTDGATNVLTSQDFIWPILRTNISVAVNRSRTSITIPIVDDDEVELNEDIFIILDPLPNQPPVGPIRITRVTILDNDQPAGALDRDWNPDNVAFTTPRFNLAPGADSIVRGVAVQADQRTVIVGDFTSYNAEPCGYIARINTDGSYDTSFSPGSGADSFISSVAIYPVRGSSDDGKIIVGGGFTSFDGQGRYGVARLNAGGSLDTTFSIGTGVSRADGFGPATVWSVAIQSDGKVLIAGDFTSVNGVARNGVARLNANGSLDMGFNPGAGADGTVWSVAILETGPRKVFLGGEFLYFNGVYRGGVARLNDNGSLDTGYEPGGGADGPVYAIALQPDGKLLLGGSFASVDFQPRSNLARLDSTGALDLSYDPGSGANDAVYAIALQADGKAFVGGAFTSFNGTRRIGLTRLFVNGTVDTSFLDTAYNQFAGLINTFHFQPPNYVNAIALETNGSVMIGGSFNALGGHYARNVTQNTPWVLGGNWAPNGAIVPGGVIGQSSGWHRADKHPRLNVARLIGGYTPGPGNIEFVLQRNNVNENAGTLQVPFRRRDGRIGTATGAVSTVDNLATNGVDFASGGGAVLWSQNDTFNNRPIRLGAVGEDYFAISILDDSNLDGDQLFGMLLRSPVGSLNLGGEIIPLGAALGNSVSEGDIIDNDRSRGVLAFSSATYSTNESANLRITVVRTNGSDGLVTVRYFTRDGSAVGGQDYSPIIQGTLSFGPNVTSQTITITNINDIIVEADETLFITLTNAANGATLAGGATSLSATAVIIDNDVLPGHPSFVSATYATNESAVVAQIAVARLGGLQGQLSVSVAATPGGGPNGATAISDFTPVTNVITWVNQDSAPKIISVPLVSDLDVEGNETVSLRLFNPSVSSATGGVNNATLTIVDDDLSGNISFSQPFYDADERGTNVSITVIRTGGTGGFVTNSFYFVDGAAINGVDYTNAPAIGSPGTLVFGPGVMATNFSVSVLDNQLQDGNRVATIVLGGFVPGSAAGDPIVADLRIFDDESVGDPAGSLDTAFSSGAGGTNAIQSLLLQPDGKLLVGGEFRTLNRVLRNRVGRLNPDGTLDRSFNPLGGPNDVVRTMALQADGRVLIGGFFTQVHGTNRNRIARLLQDGTLDRFFNPGSGADNPVYALGLLPDRRIVMGGSFTTVNGVPRAGVAVLETNGTVSASFLPGSGANGVVFAVAAQPDGKILIGGDFTNVNGVNRPRIARLNLDGSVDMTFDPGTGPSGAVRAITLQPDGKVLIGGSFTNVNGTERGRLARLDAGGALDSVFLNGIVGANADVTAIALQFDGQIIVAGEFTIFNDVSRNRITRLYRNGKTDPSINFGDGANELINAAVIQPDRKIVIGGRFTAYDSEPRFLLARIHGGSIAGAGSFEFSSPLYEATENAGQGLITVRRRGGTTSEVTVDYRTLAGTATPGLDYTDVSGTLTFPESETLRTFAVPVLNDFTAEGNESVLLVLTNETGGATLGAVPEATLTIVNDDSGVGFTAASYTVNEGSVAGAVLVSVNRLGATNGTARVNYATVNGTAVAGQDYTAQSGLLTFDPGVILQTFSVPVADDSLIEANETFGVILTNLTGSAALSIASATVTIVDNDFRAGVLAFSAPAYSVAESGGSVVISVVRTNGSTGVVSVEYATVSGTASNGLDYVAASGLLTFTDGVTNQTITVPILDDASVEGDEDFVVQLINPSTSTVVADPTSVVVRIVDEEFGPGSVDRTFDPGTGANGLVRSVSVQTNGMVLIGGSFTAFDGVARNYVARLNPNGAHDLGFDPGSGPNAFVASVAAAVADQVLIAGSFSSVAGSGYNRVALLLPGGLPDPNYRPSSEMNSAVYTMVLQPDGRALLGGAFGQPTRGITRLALDGSVDNSFVPGSGADGAVHAIAVEQGGSVIIGGNFSTVNGEPHLRVARLTSEGFVDTAFASGAIVAGTVFSMAIQSDGRIVVGGDFSTSAGPGRVNIARLNPDGSLDTTFAVGQGANSVVYALGIQSDGHIIVAGDFTVIDGVNRNRFARLNSSGALDLTFDPGRGANNTVYSLDVLPNDDLLLGGNFTLVGGVPLRGVARILAGPVAPSSFSSVSAAGGQFQLALAVTAGMRYVLESSSDLRNWSPVATNVPAGGTWYYSQPNLHSHSTRFFRVRQTGP